MTEPLACFILDTGHCLASEHHLIEGGARQQMACHSLVALLRHPQHGWFLWDAGYAPAILEATRRFPYLLYRLATPLRLRPELAVAAQLPRFGLAPADIGQVIISHFHADHIAGLRDFAAARFVALTEAYQAVAPLSGLAALRRAFIPALLPADFARRVHLLPAFNGPPLAGLGPTYDLFNDGSALLVRLPGHARGQVGLLAHTTRGRLFFVADSCWLTRSIVERRPPSSFVNFIADDPRSLRDTINRLHGFTAANPDIQIVPSHCPDALARLLEL
ncbi:MAG: MBL fold metallo-hydrolase [Anaerolineae bacterium]